jgi:hypothetical protein
VLRLLEGFRALLLQLPDAERMDVSLCHLVPIRSSRLGIGGNQAAAQLLGLASLAWPYWVNDAAVAFLGTPIALQLPVSSKSIKKTGAYHKGIARTLLNRIGATPS